jgi:hypothetical protein
MCYPGRGILLQHAGGGALPLVVSQFAGYLLFQQVRKGRLLERRKCLHAGKKFYGCSRYPDCKRVFYKND